MRRSARGNCKGLAFFYNHIIPGIQGQQAGLLQDGIDKLWCE
jgi:hypothetical protein